MQKETITIKANKYHFDLEYKYKNYSRDSWLLTKKKKFTKALFVPKSIASIFEGKNGDCEFIIPAWWVEQNDLRKEFFEY